MRLWCWLIGLFRRRARVVQDPPDEAERYRRDAEAAFAARAAETGISSNLPPAG